MSGPSTVPAFEKAAEDDKRPEKRKIPPPFSIRFTEEERARLDREAGNRPLSAHIRKKLFGENAAVRKPPARRPGVDDAALATALSALGRSRLASNLNQIAKAAHLGALPVTDELQAELEAACAEIAAMRRDLMAALGLKAE
ncbi:MAG: plasmid mobilization relaxosome protein MobC [Oricola sp.]|jgi:hypothetical protein|nr:plasmid mobilization relaxosome protein MobC [Oricola sp.]